MKRPDPAIADYDRTLSAGVTSDLNSRAPQLLRAVRAPRAFLFPLRVVFAAAVICFAAGFYLPGDMYLWTSVPALVAAVCTVTFRYALVRHGERSFAILADIVSDRFGARLCEVRAHDVVATDDR